VTAAAAAAAPATPVRCFVTVRQQEGHLACNEYWCSILQNFYWVTWLNML